MSAEEIIAEWKNKTFKPVYWLEGEEPYFMDMLTDYAEHHILSESESDFNLMVFYGRDTDWPAVVNACMRYPMFADKQVVLLKEAQHLRDIGKLENYISKPLASTVLVVSYKDKKIDGKTKFSKLLKKGGYFWSQKIKDYQLLKWTSEMIAQQGLQTEANALNLLVDNIGNDLCRLHNEVEKLTVNLKGRKIITEADIENYVGVSREFNVFELQNALAKKNLSKAIQIIQYFKANPKAGPIQLIMSILYNYFSKLYIATGMTNKSEQSLLQLFNFSTPAARSAAEALNNYNRNAVEKIILLLHHYNLKSIGIDDIGTEDAELMKELVVKIMIAD